MKIRLFVLCMVTMGFYTHAQSQTFEKTDSTVTEQYKVIEYQESGAPWKVYVTEVDLTAENVKPKVVLANNQISWNDFSFTSDQRQILSEMMEDHSEDGLQSIAGINGDFFNSSNGQVLNATVADGKIATLGIGEMPHAGFSVDEDGVPYIHMVDLSLSLIIPDSGELEFNNVNGLRNEGFLTLYNHFTGLADESPANPWGTELLLEPVDENSLNGEVKYVVMEKDGKVKMTDDSHIIVSGHDAASDFVLMASVGDTVIIKSELPGIPDSVNITDMIGGWGHIVGEGVNRTSDSMEEEGELSDASEQHPRSAIGYNQDKSKLYLIAVEGDTDESVGMTLEELADFMIDELGVWDGLNLDGGESSTLIAGEELINHPADGEQVPVPNAIIVLGETMTNVAQLFPEAVEKITVFPNPAKDRITLEWPADSQIRGEVDFKLYSVQGKALWSQSWNITGHQERKDIHLPDLIPGQYFYNIQTKNKLVATGKLIIQ